MAEEEIQEEGGNKGGMNGGGTDGGGGATGPSATCGHPTRTLTDEAHLGFEVRE